MDEDKIEPPRYAKKTRKETDEECNRRFTQIDADGSP